MQENCERPIIRLRLVCDIHTLCTICPFFFKHWLKRTNLLMIRTVITRCSLPSGAKHPQLIFSIFPLLCHLDYQLYCVKYNRLSTCGQEDKIVVCACERYYSTWKFTVRFSASSSLSALPTCPDCCKLEVELFFFFTFQRFVVCRPSRLIWYATKPQIAFRALIASLYFECFGHCWALKLFSLTFSDLFFR